MQRQAGKEYQISKIVDGFEGLDTARQCGPLDGPPTLSVSVGPYSSLLLGPGAIDEGSAIDWNDQIVRLSAHESPPVTDEGHSNAVCVNQGIH